MKAVFNFNPLIEAKIKELPLGDIPQAKLVKEFATEVILLELEAVSEGKRYTYGEDLDALIKAYVKRYLKELPSGT